MNISDFAFRLLLLFLPGIICAYIIDLLTVHRPRASFFFLLKSFVLGLGSYLTYWSVLWVWYRISKAKTQPGVHFLRALASSKTLISFREIGIVCGVAVMIGLILAFVIRKRWVYIVCRALRLTKKSGQLDVWEYAFNLEKADFVTVRDRAEGLAYYGRVGAFSDDGNRPQLFLQDVQVLSNETGELLYKKGAIYIGRDWRNITIEFEEIEYDASYEQEQGEERTPERKEANEDGQTETCGEGGCESPAEEEETPASSAGTGPQEFTEQ